MGSKYFVDVINAGAQSVSVAGGSDADLKLTEGSNTWTIRHNGSDSDLEFLYNNEERLMVAEDGSSITQTADTGIDADFKVKVDSGQDASLTLEEGINDWKVRNTGSNGELDFLYNNTSSFKITDTGGVVIGGSDPFTSMFLFVKGTSGVNASVPLSNIGSPGDVERIGRFQLDAGATLDFLSDGTGVWFHQGLTNTGFMAFATRTSTDNIERVRITNDGDVGIGTISPDSMLHIAADAAADADLKVSVDSGQDASLTLEEGTNDWKITNNGTSGRLSTAYNGSEAFAVSDGLFPVVPSYTVASLPTAESGGMIFVTDETGGAVLAFGDATGSPAVWRRVTDRAIVS